MMKYNKADLPIYYKWIFNFMQPFRRESDFLKNKSVQSITHFAFWLSDFTFRKTDGHKNILCSNSYNSPSPN